MDILVVDDSRLARAWVQSHLQALGFEVETLEPGSVFDVLSALHEGRPRMLITDYEMPGCNGESLVRAVREDPEVGRTPILLYSAHGEADLVERLSRWELCAFLIKPVAVDLLQHTVVEQFRRRGLALPEGAQGHDASHG